jgi:predicted lipid-binding transport protein (Tim44 family)
MTRHAAPFRRKHVNRLLVVALAAFAALAVAHADFADAARMGGGRSLGMQRSITPPAAKTPPATSNAISGPAANPVLPATPGASATRGATAAGAPAAGAAAAAPASRWLAPIAGIAAGLGLAALLSHFGLPEGLGTILLLGLLVVGAILLVRMLVAGRSRSPLRYAGAPGATPRSSYEPAREPASGSAWGGGSPPAGRYPPGFDPVPFLDQAKQQFRRLQAAYDRADLALLDDVTTPQMQAEIARDVAARGTHMPTDVVALEAELVEVVQEGDRYVASVRFHGTLREDGAATPLPFEELWHLVKPVDGSSGWLLAGIQQYA